MSDNMNVSNLSKVRFAEYRRLKRALSKTKRPLSQQKLDSLMHEAKLRALATGDELHQDLEDKLVYKYMADMVENMNDEGMDFAGIINIILGLFILFGLVPILFGITLSLWGG